MRPGVSSSIIDNSRRRMSVRFIGWWRALFRLESSRITRMEVQRTKKPRSGNACNVGGCAEMTFIVLGVGIIDGGVVAVCGLASVPFSRASQMLLSSWSAPLRLFVDSASNERGIDDISRAGLWPVQAAHPHSMRPAQAAIFASSGAGESAPLLCCGNENGPRFHEEMCGPSSIKIWHRPMLLLLRRRSRCLRALRRLSSANAKEPRGAVAVASRQSAERGCGVWSKKCVPSNVQRTAAAPGSATPFAVWIEPETRT